MKSAKKQLCSIEVTCSEHDGKENQRQESRFSSLQRKLKRTRSHATDITLVPKVIDTNRKNTEKSVKADQNAKPKSRVARVKKALSFKKKKKPEYRVTRYGSVVIAADTTTDESSVDSITEYHLIDCPPPTEDSTDDNDSVLDYVDGDLMTSDVCAEIHLRCAPSLETSQKRDQSEHIDWVPDDNVSQSDPSPVSTVMDDGISENMEMYNDLSNCSLIECLNNINMMASARMQPSHYDADNSHLQTTIFDCTLDASVDECDVTVIGTNTNDATDNSPGSLLRSQKQWGAQMDLTKLDQTEDDDKTPNNTAEINSSGDKSLSLSGIKKLFALNRSSSRSQSALGRSNSNGSKFTLNRHGSKSQSSLNRSSSRKNPPLEGSKSKSQSSLRRSHSNSSPKLRSSSKSQSSLDRISHKLRTTLDRSYKKIKSNTNTENCKSNGKVAGAYVKRDSVCSATSRDTIGTPVSSEIGGSMNNLTLISTPVLKSHQQIPVEKCHQVPAEKSHQVPVEKSLQTVTEEEPQTRPQKRPRHPSVKFDDQHAEVKRAKVTRVNSIKQAWKNTLRRNTSHVESTCGQHQGQGKLYRENAGHTPRVTRRNKQPDYDERLI